MPSETDNLPLFELFNRLRQAGLPLGIGEYNLLLRALQAGFGLPDRAALARLCRTLWVKSPDEAPLFDYLFDHYIANLLSSQTTGTADMPTMPSTLSPLPEAWETPAHPTATDPAPVVQATVAAAQLVSANPRAEHRFTLNRVGLTQLRACAPMWLAQSRAAAFWVRLETAGSPDE